MSTPTTYLPLHVIAEILIRLPPKSLLRFRCVSKSWCSEIDGPYLIRRHLQHSLHTNSNLSVIIREDYEYPDLHVVDDLKTLTNLSARKLIPPLDSFTDVLGSCNGLLAVLGSEFEYSIWNPCTQKHRNLPLSPIKVPPLGRGYAVFQYVAHGFGYDSIRDDYKLLRVSQYCKEGEDQAFHMEVKVYSSQSDSWRQIRGLRWYLMPKTNFGALVNEALHWEVELNSKYFIVAFDLGSEVYRLVQTPDCGFTGDFQFSLGVLGGQLCVAYTDFVDRVEVWVMKEYGMKESWSRLFALTLPEMAVDYVDYVHPLFYSKGDDRLLLVQDKERLMLYDMVRKRVEDVKIKDGPHHFMTTHVIVGSLATVSGGVRDGGRLVDEGGNKKSGKKRRADEEMV